MSDVRSVKMHKDIADELYEILIHQPNPIGSCDLCETYHFIRSMTPLRNDCGEVLDFCNDCIASAKLWRDKVVAYETIEPDDYDSTRGMYE